MSSSWQLWIQGAVNSLGDSSWFSLSLTQEGSGVWEGPWGVHAGVSWFCPWLWGGCSVGVLLWSLCCPGAQSKYHGQESPSDLSQRVSWGGITPGRIWDLGNTHGASCEAVPCSPGPVSIGRGDSPAHPADLIQVVRPEEGWAEPLLPRMAVPWARDWDGCWGDANKGPCRCSRRLSPGMGTQRWQAVSCAPVSLSRPRLPLTLALA